MPLLQSFKILLLIDMNFQKSRSMMKLIRDFFCSLAWIMNLETSPLNHAPLADHSHENKIGLTVLCYVASVPMMFL